jgi:hypothetical protein
VHELTGDKKFLGSKLPHASPSPVIGNQSTAIGKLLIGLSITALLTIGKIGLEQTRFGQQLEQMTVNLLQLRLADAARVRYGWPWSIRRACFRSPQVLATMANRSRHARS